MDSCRNSSPRPMRSRAKRACRRCNFRRIKCNVTETWPCKNCASTGTSCELSESRRGKHPRKITKPINEVTPYARTAHPKSGPVLMGGATAANPFLDIHDSPRAGDGMVSQSSSENFQRKLFLGESVTLRCIYEDGSGGCDEPENVSPIRVNRLQYSVPSVSGQPAEWEMDRKRRRIQSLASEGVFDLPNTATVEMLLDAYLRWFHPCFPIVDPAELRSGFEDRSLSPLLMQAVLSVAAAHCDDEKLALAGLESRQRARYLFYCRAEDIYNANYETEHTSMVQAVFLMSFWCASQALEKHTRHWLGVAINLAQQAAMHRCLPNLPARKARLHRRIWWSIYTRERQCAAAQGLPSRIRDEDCDVEALKDADFEWSRNETEVEAQEDSSPPGTPIPPKEQALYAIEMAQLARYLGQIIDTEHLPTRRPDAVERRQTLKEQLFAWKSNLPGCLTFQERCGERLGLYTAMLHIAFNNLLILLFRNSYLRDPEGRSDPDGSLAIDAASTNCNLIESLLSQNLVKHGDLHLLNDLLNTLCIQMMHVRRSEGTARTVAEHRARLCLVGIHELEKTWQVTVWLLQLQIFFQSLDRSTIQRLHVDDTHKVLSAKVAPAMPANAIADLQSLHAHLMPQEPLDTHSGLLSVQSSSLGVPLNPSGDTAGFFEWPCESPDETLHSSMNFDVSSSFINFPVPANVPL